MRLNVGGILFFPILCSLLITSTAWGGMSCEEAAAAFVKKDSYTLINWNLENLGAPDERTGPGVMTAEHRKSKRQQKDDLRPKRPEEAERMRQFLKAQDPDAGVFQEVENVKALRFLLAQDASLKDKYHIFLKEGNDTRGIDIAFIVKKSLGFRYKLESHKALTRTVKTGHRGHETETTMPLFSRDFPVLMLYVPGTDVPVFILGGMHAKSKRQVISGDFESTDWRTDQLNEVPKILMKYEERFGKVRMAAAGDWNTEVQRAPEAAELRKETTSAFDMVPKAQQLRPEDRATHSYFPPNNGRPQHDQVDDVRFRNMPAGSVISVEIIRDNLPRTFKERQQQMSDHFPVKVVFKIFD